MIFSRFVILYPVLLFSDTMRFIEKSNQVGKAIGKY